MKKKRNVMSILRMDRDEILLKMKLLTLLIFAAFVSASASSYSQLVKFNLNLKDVSISDVFQKIEEQSEFIILFNEKSLNVDRKVNVTVKDGTVDQILDQIFEGKKEAYQIFDRQILISKLNKISKIPLSELQNMELQQQQKKELSGKVIDSNGGTLPGVSVVVKGTSTGIVTDANGNFTLSVSADANTLVFSFVGMKTQEIVIGKQSTFKITMQEETVGIDEVVAIGYGFQKKINVIGSVVSVSSKEITSSSVAGISNTLAGRLPGVIVEQGSGQPGFDEAIISIRGAATLGNSAPLVVIDGVPGRDLNSVEPNDIESVTVLKDASAAIYGAQAANGVILITSKRGIEAAKPTFRYEFYKGFTTPTMLPEMADAGTYAQMIREMQTYKNVAESNMSFSLSDIEKYKSGEYPWTHPNTNWFDASLNKYASSDHHTFSVNGGSKNIKYYTSFGSQNDGVIYKNSASSYKRYTLKANLDIKINEYLSLGIDIGGSQENRLSPISTQRDVYYSLIKGRPTDAAIWPNGYIAPAIPDGNSTGITGTLEAGSKDDIRYRSQNRLSATFKVPKIEGLTLSGYYVYDMSFNVVKDFRKPWINYNLNKNAYLAAGNTGKEDGSAYLIGAKMTFPEPRLTDSYGDSKTKIINLKANYDKTINGVHNLNAFIAYESSEYMDKGISAFRRYFLSDQLPYLFAGSVTDQSINSSVNIDSRINYFGRFSYNYNEKYLFEFTFRRDGSLRFSEENGRWGNFPSLLAGWRISNEDFWKRNIPFIDYFKLRASWGQMGNDQVGAFQYLSNYGFGTGTVFGTGKLYTNALYQSGTPNPLITWEVGNVFNIGFESRFFNNKMKLDAEYFYQRRNNILVKRNASVPQFTGISLPDENFGIVDNKGVEVVLGYADRKGDWSYSINGNISYAKNSIVEFDEPARSVPWQVMTGHPIGSIQLYKSLGIFNDANEVAAYPHVSTAKPGDIIIEDVSGDGIINGDDKVIFEKTASPKITYGVTLGVTYKNWSLAALVQGVGNCMRDMYLQLQGTGGNYFAYDANGRWTPDNITASKPKAWEREESYWRTNYKTDYTYHNAAYARLKNLQVSYTIPRNIQKAVLLQGAEIYFSGQNLLMLYSGNKIMDSELGSPTNYPLMKVFSLGAKFAF